MYGNFSSLVQSEQRRTDSSFGGTGNGTIQCLEHMEVTMGHMGMKALDRIPVTRFSREYMMETLMQAGKMFALHYADWQ